MGKGRDDMSLVMTKKKKKEIGVFVSDWVYKKKSDMELKGRKESKMGGEGRRRENTG